MLMAMALRFCEQNLAPDHAAMLVGEEIFRVFGPGLGALVQ